MIVVARWLAALLLLAMPATGLAEGLRGTGNLGLVIERATGSVLVVDTSAPADDRPRRGRRRSLACFGRVLAGSALRLMCSDAMAG